MTETYTALARKWRPRAFAELVGQEHVSRALVNALQTGRVHHAFLFTGTRGVGKTTIARILAKCLNCESGVTATPCGECASCREIDAGRFVDLIEVDAASRTKVDDTRELLDNVQYAPTRGRYKVYLIDEVHMLSTHSFNALLKTLEEPPPHVKFLLATTDPQKLPVTVLSRCLQFNLKRIPIAQIAAHLLAILEKEGIEFEPAGLKLVAQAADGSMRDGLSLLDQLIAFGGGRAGEAEARAMLGTIARDHVLQLAQRLAKADPVELLRYAQSLEEWAPDYAQVLDELASLLTRIALKQVVKDFDGDDLYEPQVLEGLADAIAPEDLQLYYQTAIMSRRDLPLAPDPRTGFEMALLRMVAFRPQTGASGETASARAGLRGPGAPPPGTATGTAPSSSGPSSSPAPAASMPRTAAGAPPGSPGSSSSQGAGAPLQPTATPAPPGAQEWAAVLAALELQGATRQLATHCVLVGREGAVVRLALDPRSKFMRTAAVEEKLAQAMTRYYGEPMRVEFTTVAPQAETPAQAGQRASEEEAESARRAFESDPGVQGFRERFGATALPETIRPLK